MIELPMEASSDQRKGVQSWRAKFENSEEKNGSRMRISLQ
jgi:hypothetical protein